ncbi:MAG: biotin synthase BioB [Candidatus Binatia bacterium]|jgi:biotin synthase|nr:biotin synthase BioB [Candidatus Binatia bacterium]MDG2009739.1 biotin synthase BioB [Candidatus Binatia bacterium]
MQTQISSETETPSGTGSFFSDLADRVLAGGIPTREEAHRILSTPLEEMEDLLAAALRIREKRWGRGVKICMLQNARSGLCPEDCNYCSQSKVSTAEIETYTLMQRGQLIQGASRAVERGARRYCMATSGRGPSDRDINEFCATTRAIKREHPDLEICVSLGLMDDEKAVKLKDAGVGWVNHNLNTSERHHDNICSTHTYADRVATVQAAKRAGMNTCCGGIIGMGEDNEDVVQLGFALRELGVDSLPVNFLHPIEGTPLGNEDKVDKERALRALCLMRFLNPEADIRAAGGSETTLGEDEHLALYPANSIFVAGYLTTPGRSADEARQMIEDRGFFVDGTEIEA